MSCKPYKVHELVHQGFVAEYQNEDKLPELRAHAASDVMRRTFNFSKQFEAVKCAAGARQIAIVTPRRSGKSDAFMRWVAARVFSRDKYVVRIISSSLSAPSDNFLDCSHQESFLDLVIKYGLMPYCHIKRAAGSVKRIRFTWGSEIHVEDVGTIPAIDRKRGFSANLYWADEAQSIALLALVLKDLVRPTMADHDGQLVLTGTPGNEIDSLFYLACNDDDGTWATARYYSWQNPHFGATDEERWAKLCDYVIIPGRHEYALSDDDIEKLCALTQEEREQIANGEERGELAEWVKTLDVDLLREVFGRWVFGGKSYVYRWYEAQQLYWAQVSKPIYQPDKDKLLSDLVLADTLFERIAQLPKRQVFNDWKPRTWYAVVSADPGTEHGPSGSAFVVLVYSEGYEYALELWSEVQDDFHLSETLQHAAKLVEILQDNGVQVTTVVGDFTSTGVSPRQWSEEFGARLPSNVMLQMPKKAHKREQTAILNLDLMSGKLKLIAGDALDAEGRNLRYKPFKPEKGGDPVIDKWRQVTLPNSQTKRLGDHCLDALRYAAPFVPTLFKQKLPEMKFKIQAPVDQARERMERHSPFNWKN